METDGKGNVTYTAIPAKDSNAAPIPENHSRFYCSKCHTVRLVSRYLPKQNWSAAHILYTVGRNITSHNHPFLLHLMPFISSLFRFRVNTSRAMTYQIRQLRGDVQIAMSSIQLCKVNVNGAQFYKMHWCERRKARRVIRSPKISFRAMELNDL